MKALIRLCLVGSIAFSFALAVPLAAQDAACDAEPRWLTVTVVGSEFIDAEGEVSELFRDGNQGAQMLDRCRGYISISEDRRIRPGGVSQANIDISYRDGSLRFYFVKESVQDICAAVSDCADATDGLDDGTPR